MFIYYNYKDIYLQVILYLHQYKLICIQDILFLLFYMIYKCHNYFMINLYKLYVLLQFYINIILFLHINRFLILFIKDLELNLTRKPFLRIMLKFICLIILNQVYLIFNINNFI